MVFLDHTKHSDLDFDKITLLDTSCTLNDYGDFNSTHLWMNVPFDSCKTNHSTEAGTITYTNSILSETRAAAGSVLISREFQAEFPFKCSYPRSAVLSVANFSPREKVVYTKTGKSLIEGTLKTRTTQYFLLEQPKICTLVLRANRRHSL